MRLNAPLLPLINRRSVRSTRWFHRASVQPKRVEADMAMAAGDLDICNSSGQKTNGLGSESSSVDGISILNDSFPCNKSTSLNMSFAGCGFLGIYHLGTASAFQKHGRKFLQRVDRFAGASAGALVASILAIRGEDPDIVKQCIDFTYNLAKGVQGHKFGLLTPGLSLLDSLKDFLNEQLPEDAHITATDRLYVSLTSADSKRNIIVSEFDSKEDLIQCLLASSYVPHITGAKPVMRNGKKFIDGGMTDNLPILQEGRTVCVSPFSGRYEVCPLDSTGKNLHVNILKQDFQVNIQNIIRGLHAFFPPKLSQLENYFHKGVRDAEHFLRKEGWYEESEDEKDGDDKCGSVKDSTDVISKTSTSTPNPSDHLQYESAI